MLVVVWAMTTAVLPVGVRTILHHEQPSSAVVIPYREDRHPRQQHARDNELRARSNFVVVVVVALRMLLHGG